MTVTLGPLGPGRGEASSFETVMPSIAAQPGTAVITQSTGSRVAEASQGPLSAVPKHDAAAKDLFFAAVASDQHSREAHDLLGPDDLSADLL